MQVRHFLAQCHAELDVSGIKYDANMPVGAMIEVPAAAVCADLFARQADSLSIGTNDLIQYTIAIDRIDDEVSYLYDPVHPAVLRLIQTVIRADITRVFPSRCAARWLVMLGTMRDCCWGSAYASSVFILVHCSK